MFDTSIILGVAGGVVEAVVAAYLAARWGRGLTGSAVSEFYEELARATEREREQRGAEFAAREALIHRIGLTLGLGAGISIGAEVAVVLFLSFVSSRVPTLVVLLPFVGFGLILVSYRGSTQLRANRTSFW